MIDDVVIGFENAVGQPVLAQKLPDVFGRIQLWTFRRQRNERDVGRHDQLVGHVPAGAVDDESGVGPWRDSSADFDEEQIHRVGVAGRENKRRALAVLWTDGAEYVGRGGALIVGRARPRPAFGPSARDLVFLADARLVLEPDFYFVGGDALLARDFFQTSWETFLKSSIAPSAWA